MLRLGWFSTGRGEGSRGFLELVQGEILAGRLEARIQFVFTNREPGEAEGSDRYMGLVRSYGIPLLSLSSRRWRREHGGGPFSRHRDAFHRRVMDLIAPYDFDVGVLAGYMLVTSGEMCRRYDLINLHPAPPGGPPGTWQEVIWRLIEEGASEGGVTVHVATEELDAGPTLAYCTFPIRGPRFDPLWEEARRLSPSDLRAQGEEQPLFQAIRREGLRRERPLLLETLRSLARGEVRVRAGRVLDESGRPVEGRRLNEAVERFLRERGL